MLIFYLICLVGFALGSQCDHRICEKISLKAHAACEFHKEVDANGVVAKKDAVSPYVLTVFHNEAISQSAGAEMRCLPNAPRKCKEAINAWIQCFDVNCEYSDDRAFEMAMRTKRNGSCAIDRTGSRTKDVVTWVQTAADEPHAVSYYKDKECTKFKHSEWPATYTTFAHECTPYDKNPTVLNQLNAWFGRSGMLYYKVACAEPGTLVETFYDNSDCSRSIMDPRQPEKELEYRFTNGKCVNEDDEVTNWKANWTGFCEGPAPAPAHGGEAVPVPEKFATSTNFPVNTINFTLGDLLPNDTCEDRLQSDDVIRTDGKLLTCEGVLENDCYDTLKFSSHNSELQNMLLFDVVTKCTATCAGRQFDFDFSLLVLHLAHFNFVKVVADGAKVEIACGAEGSAQFGNEWVAAVEKKRNEWVAAETTDSSIVEIVDKNNAFALSALIFGIFALLI